ncbi:MAG: prolipoprotein diacylglyceryl transferase [Oscillospiraceae bacterium]|jgi:phosphatidylglycerol:prolipoprotein diacylglycerol transferase|nr:prolipoprotein diacylglyceryl transferase [Oscillospiraceae bacterium]
MHPFIEIFGLQIGTYSIFALIGFFSGAVVVLLRRKKYPLAPFDILALFGVIIVGVIVGSKILYIITRLPGIIKNFGYLFTDFQKFSDAYFGGMVFYGGLIGAAVAAFGYCRYMKVDFSQVCLLFVPIIPLIHGIARIGCFFAGCCYGIHTPAPWGVAFTHSLGAPNGVTLLPVQLYEAALNLIIFAALMLYTRKPRNVKNVLAIYMVSYGIVRFVLEFFRGDAIRGVFMGISTSQVISLILIAGGLFLVFAAQKREKVV